MGIMPWCMKADTEGTARQPWDTEHQVLPVTAESQEEAKRESQVWPASTPISVFYSPQAESRNGCCLQAHRCLSQQLHKTNPLAVQETAPPMPPAVYPTSSSPDLLIS